MQLLKADGGIFGAVRPDSYLTQQPAGLYTDATYKKVRR